MSDIDLAVSHCKRLESLLEDKLGATGRGLHEKVSSVEDRLPADVVRKLRLVATVRNKIVHESDYKNIDDRKRFLEACKSAEKQLKLLGRKPGGVGPLPIAAVLIILILLTVLVYRMMHR